MKRKIIAGILAVMLLAIQWIPVQYAITSDTIEQENTEQENTEQENTEQENTEQDNTEQGNTEQENTEQDNTEQENTEQDNTEQENTEQENIEQDNTEQENTEQDNAEQDNIEQEGLKQEEKKQDELEEDIKTKLTIIQQASEKKYLENDQGYMQSKIISIEEGKVIIDLSLSNISSNTESELQKYDDTEILIIVPENIANDKNELNEYISYIETLAKKVFEKNSNTKIGIVGMKGTINDTTIDENGNSVKGEQDEAEVDGTVDNAEIVVDLTNDANNIKNGLESMNTDKTRYRNNLQAAIRLAQNSYSHNVNKILISLYDNVPSIAIGECSKVSYGRMVFRICNSRRSNNSKK